MAAWIRGARTALLAAMIVGLGSTLSAAAAVLPPGQDWYPADIAPPTGTQYPCALKALPRDLQGIPSGDRLFINHLYSMILRATRSKLALQKALGEGRGPALAAALADYRRTSGDALAKIRAESAPARLEKFAENVTAALALQRTTFEKAVQARIGGGPAGQEYQLPEARAASQKLMAAWAQMTQRYPEWPPEMQDSIYHHLCALDLF